MRKTFTIKNFKPFKSLELTQLSRVNLIVGKNNSGKTCLLEALWIDGSQADFPVIKDILGSREAYWEFDEDKQNYDKHPARSLFHGHHFPTKTDEILSLATVTHEEQRTIVVFSPPALLDQFNHSGQIDHSGQVSYNPKEPTVFFLRDNSLVHTYRLLGNGGFIDREIPENVIFVPSSQLLPYTVDKLWAKISLTSLEDSIIQGLSLLEPNIQRIGIMPHSPGGDRIPVVALGAQRIALKTLGEGVTRIFQILLALVNCKDGTLLIDEFENGLHWSVQPKLWEMIFTLAEQLDIQVFVTTHSRDCVEAFHYVWQQKEETQGSFYRLYDHPKKGIIATSYPREILADTLETGGEMR